MQWKASYWYWNFMPLKMMVRQHITTSTLVSLKFYRQTLQTQHFFFKTIEEKKLQLHFFRELLFNENLSCHYNIVAVVLIFTPSSWKLQHAISTIHSRVLAHCWCSHLKQLTRDVFTLSSVWRFFIFNTSFSPWLFKTTIIILKAFWVFVFSRVSIFSMLLCWPFLFRRKLSWKMLWTKLRHYSPCRSK
jgi:hypothetical protein